MTDDNLTEPVPPSLIGDKVYLRPITEDDVRLIHSWSMRTEPQSQTSRPRLFASTDQAVEGFRNRKNSETEQGFTICRKDDERPIGTIRFFGVNNLNRSAELGLLVDPDEHRHGYGSDAMRVVIRHLFRNRGLHKVYAMTGGFNEATYTLLEKLGFKRDAVLRDHFFWDGKYHDGYIYSLLDSEVGR